MHGNGTAALLEQQSVARLLCKTRKVLQGIGVSRAHAQHLPALHRHQRFFGFQNGQRTVEAADIKLSVEVWGIHRQYGLNMAGKPIFATTRKPRRGRESFLLRVVFKVVLGICPTLARRWGNSPDTTCQCLRFGFPF